MHFKQREFDVGVQASEFADDGREEVSGAPEEESDGERACFASQGAAGALERQVGGGDGAAGFFQEHAALGGECGALAAVEERAADLVFEVCDLLRNGRLRDVEAASCLAEGAVFCNGDEVS